eukprot:6207872-Pleurochrysis_carterae.AAC.2
MCIPALAALAARTRNEVGRKARFQRPTALALVYPNEAHNGSAFGHLRTVDSGPALVVAMILDFRTLGGRPSSVIIEECLFASPGICRGASGGSAAGVTAVETAYGCVTCKQQCVRDCVT